MTKEERADLAAQIKANGNNCCQAVALAFADTVDVDDATLRRIASGFGLGIGCMEATCGALVGAAMVAGLKTDSGATQVTKDILSRFKSKCGSTVCRELKGIDTGKVLCSCEDCVRNAVLASETAKSPLISATPRRAMSGGCPQKPIR